ncbi:hypothetical protein [Nonomuraea sp. 10N515B]|uniref:hypothetical protein n=1 Tax=Nonomuraea sp. 10N515B TaxID=3457422 RepID=UPI003FCC99E7
MGELRFEVGDASVLEAHVGARGLETFVEAAVIGGELTDPLLEGGVFSSDALDGFLGPLGFQVADLAEELPDAGPLGDDLGAGCFEGVFGAVDLMAHILADRLESVEEIVTTHVVVGGGMSRGSLRSLVETTDAIKAGGMTYHDGDWRPGMPARHTAITLPGQSEATPVMAFPVSEVVTIPRHIRVRHVQGLTEAALGAQLNTPLTPEIIQSLPEGPDEDSRRTQHFTYVLDATSTDGRRARGIVRGPDTYGITAVIAVESARRLIAEPAKPGELAPAQAYHPTAFLDFLIPHGIQWIVEDAPAT